MEVCLIKTYGRKVIKVNYTEEQLLSANIEEQNAMIVDIIEQSRGIHEYNKFVTRYLKGYYLGIQDIRNKIKYTREEINNKTTENWCYAFVDFKTCYLLGKPIQYVQLNDSGEEEISLLNKYVRFENKKDKDKALYIDMLTCGRGFRYTNFKTKSIYNDEDDIAPFEIINCEADNTEVVYSNRLGNEQILSYIQTDMEYINTTIDPVTKEQITSPQKYEEYTVYLRNRKVVVSNKTGVLAIEPNSDDIILLNDHVITEYYLNSSRISLIEIGKDLFDDINYLESLDKDDMEQFVNAIMVFTNAEIDENGLSQMKALGAVCINSTDNKKASVDLLQQRLNATDTQVYYTRLITSLHQILGVPMSTDNGSVTSGDTGKAKLTGQGYTMAGIRSEGEQTTFERGDMATLRKLLKICRKTANSKITELRASDVEARFQRDMSENLLVKTQALLNLYSADIPRKFANAIIGLFGDPNAVTKEQENLFGEQTSQQGASNKEDNGNGGNLDDTKTTNDNDITTQQENKIQDVIEKNEQGNA